MFVCNIVCHYVCICHCYIHMGGGGAVGGGGGGWGELFGGRHGCFDFKVVIMSAALSSSDRSREAAMKTVAFHSVNLTPLLHLPVPPLCFITWSFRHRHMGGGGGGGATMSTKSDKRVRPYIYTR